MSAVQSSPAAPEVWGILNVTPDSFSDGGAYLDPQRAVDRARRLAADGAHVIDVGGESTRPGSQPVTPAVEQARVLPVVAALAAEGLRVSIDTMHASTAAASVDAGAAIVNDVSGGLADPAMLETVAGLDVDYVVMHWRGPAAVWDAVSDYRDVVTEVRDELHSRLEAALAAGIPAGRLWLDPGLGFAKRHDDSWALLRALSSLTALGHRVLVGASRKRFLGELLPPEHAVEERDLPTAVVSVLAADGGAAAVRVHDARSTVRALATHSAWQGGGAGRSARTEVPA
ncbi:MAG: dihydropteroate synthase [Microcella sp.]|uniref:dihydropteroate synthase n=1 Tax=Microcella sp. TaxID=1913979 RepID=UPI003314DDA5